MIMNRASDFLVHMDRASDFVVHMNRASDYWFTSGPYLKKN